MKQLYEINVDMIYYVMAEDEDEALEIGHENLTDECDLSAIRPTAIFASHEDSHPYLDVEDNDNRTVGEVFDAEREDERKYQERVEWEKKQLKLF